MYTIVKYKDALHMFNKEEAVGISTLLRSSKKVMSERPHLAFIEEMSS
jgi:hypothetical protein